jgi:hypothetical protein
MNKTQVSGERQQMEACEWSMQRLQHRGAVCNVAGDWQMGVAGGWRGAKGQSAWTDSSTSAQLTNKQRQLRLHYVQFVQGLQARWGLAVYHDPDVSQVARLPVPRQCGHLHAPCTQRGNTGNTSKTGSHV